MSVEKRKLPSGRTVWLARWRDPNGKNRSKNFARKEDALAHERTTRVDTTRGKWVDPDKGKITLSRWFETCLAGAHNLRPRSIQTYRETWVRIGPALGHLQIKHVTDTQIDTYLSALGEEVGPWTVHRHYRTLRWLFRAAVKRGRIPESPVDAVAEPYVPDEEMRFLTAVELEALADAIDVPTGRRAHTRYGSLVRVGGWGGPRWGELAGFRAKRVDRERPRIHIVSQLDPTGRVESEPKSAAGKRWVTIPESVWGNLLEEIAGMAPDDLVWTSPTGQPLRHANFLRRDFHPAAARAGLGQILEDGRYEGVSPHDLRHTSVALAIQQGAHAKEIQRRLGDKSIKVTLDRYGHLFEGMDEKLGRKLDDARTAALTERRKLRVV